MVCIQFPVYFYGQKLDTRPNADVL